MRERERRKRRERARDQCVCLSVWILFSLSADERDQAHPVLQSLRIHTQRERDKEKQTEGEKERETQRKRKRQSSVSVCLSGFLSPFWLTLRCQTTPNIEGAEIEKKPVGLSDFLPLTYSNHNTYPSRAASQECYTTSAARSEHRAQPCTRLHSRPPALTPSPAG